MSAISFERSETDGLVSIVIPTHRGERFIGDTLASIGHQTYPHWEVIVVEDGSCGPTEKIVKSFARRYPKHRVEYSRSDRNYGTAHTRNLAFAKAGGQFVALLDSDDRWFPDHLTRSVKELQTSGKDIAYSTVLMIEDGTDRILGVWGPSTDELADFPQSLQGRSFVTPSATVMRRTVLADVGAWNTQLRYCEDFEFWLRCIAVGKQFHCVGGCHCLYRKNHEGATTQKMCGTLEEVAMVTEQFIDTPRLRPKTCRKHASKAYALAARFHAKADPLHDRSADRSRAPWLMLKAWRLRQKRVGYLLEGAAYYVGQLLHRPIEQMPTPCPPVVRKHELSQRRAAAATGRSREAAARMANYARKREAKHGSEVKLQCNS
jgi:GT2 family glycosyltransferase